jgi:PPK2 family polyphosphate:nucleotide phosphotransferase
MTNEDTSRRRRSISAIKPGTTLRLAHVDPDDTSLVPGGKVKGKEKSAEILERLADLQEMLFAEHKQRVLIVLQGMDTSGKDGAVRHLMDGFNPLGTRVVSFKAPTEEERDHDYLWRVHRKVPAKGEVVVFNRSHYEDVLVPRVHDAIGKRTCRERYQQINDFERMQHENGMTIIKFFLHISRAEQRERLQARIDDPRKRWKFQHGDIEERKLWDDYQRAYQDAIEATATKHAPWYIVPANAKWYRDYMLATVVEETLAGLKMKFPQPDLSGVVIA